MGTADIDFWSKEWPMITGAPHLFFGGILVISAVIWFLVNWAYRHRFAAKDDQLDARDERLTHAKEKQQDAEQKAKDLQFIMEKLETLLQAAARIEDIAIMVSSAKTKAEELVDACNAVSSAINDNSDPLSNTQALRATQSNIYNAWWGG
jgi:DNA repair ATPase RecN